jgi:hypothetical protein
MIKNETPEQARQRISNALSGEIKAHQAEGQPNEMIALRVYASLIECRYMLEQKSKEIANLNLLLNKEINNIVNESKTFKSC